MYARTYVCFSQVWQCSRLWSGLWISIAQRSLVILWSLLVRLIAIQQCPDRKGPLDILWLFHGTASTIWLFYLGDLFQDDLRLFLRICFGLVLPCITSWLGNLAAQKQFCNQFGRFGSLPAVLESQGWRRQIFKKKQVLHHDSEQNRTLYGGAMKSYEQEIEQLMFCYACCGRIETATAGTAALRPLLNHLINRLL